MQNAIHSWSTSLKKWTNIMMEQSTTCILFLPYRHKFQRNVYIPTSHEIRRQAWLCCSQGKGNSRPWIKRCRWYIANRSTLPDNTKPIRAIWSVKWKRRPYGSLLKHKARICAHSGMHRWEDDYWEKQSPVVNMMSVRLLLLIAKIHKQYSKATDFVLVFFKQNLTLIFGRIYQ